MRLSLKNMRILIVSIAIAAVCLSGLHPVYADSGSNTGDSGSNVGDSGSNTSIVPLSNPLEAESIGQLIQGFVEIFSYVVVLGAVLALIWVGLQFILARGNADRMKELKDWLFWIIIGVAVVIGARLIIQVVINTLSASGIVDERTIQGAQRAADGR